MQKQQNSAVIHITDAQGQIIAPLRFVSDEPHPGSVVLTEGEFGTAWQRFFSDGRWHPTRGGGTRSWQQLTGRRNLVLVYDAPERD